MTRRVEVGGGPAGLAVADGAVWRAPTRRGRAEAPWRDAQIAPAETASSLDPARRLATARVARSYATGIRRTRRLRRVGGMGGSGWSRDLARGCPSRATMGGRSFPAAPGLRFADGDRSRRRTSAPRSIGRPPGGGCSPFFAGIVPGGHLRRLRGDPERGSRPRARPGRSPSTSGLAPQLLHKLTSRSRPGPKGAPMRREGDRRRGPAPIGSTAYEPKGGGRLSRNPHFRSWSHEARPDGLPRRDPLRAWKRRARRRGSAGRGPRAGNTCASWRPGTGRTSARSRRCSPRSTCSSTRAGRRSTTRVRVAPSTTPSTAGASSRSSEATTAAPSRLPDAATGPTRAPPGLPLHARRRRAARRRLAWS